MNYSTDYLRGIKNCKAVLPDTQSSPDLLGAIINSWSGKLTRIEGLVVITGAMLIGMFILDTFRRRSRNPVLKLLLLILDTVSSSILTYTMGLMQSFPLKNKLFEIWAVLLPALKESIDYVSAFGVDDVHRRRIGGLRDLMNTFWVAYLSGTRATDFKILIWILWALNCSRILYRIRSCEKAAESYSMGKNSMLVDDYMKYEHELITDSEAVDPASMSGYKYLVMGEGDQKIEPRKPGYLIQLQKTHDSRLITLDKIWKCEGKLLTADGGDSEGRLKDVCLSFALCKLLRRRFYDFDTSSESVHEKNRQLVFQGLLSDANNNERVFRVIEIELAFLNDYFYTRYPIIFCMGFPIFSILVFFMMGIICLILVVMLIGDRVSEDGCYHVVNGVNVDMVITFVLLNMVILKEEWEIATYIFSDWAKVVLLCKYVEKPSWQRSVCVEKLLKILCRCRITKPWHQKIGQYSLLSSFDYKPWNIRHKLTCGLARKTVDGARKPYLIRLPEEVKEAIVSFLRTNGSQFTNGKLSLEKNGFGEELSWACSLETNIHTLMAWHIATSLCEIESFQRCSSQVKSLSSLKRCVDKLHSCIIHIKNWWSPPPFLLSLKDLKEDWQSNYIVATSLSKYCAYLVAFNRDLLPDSRPSVEFVFKDLIREARELLQGHDSMSSRYERMMNLEHKGDSIIEKGIKLGKQLIQIPSESTRWKVLAEFWTERMLYISPSCKTGGHKNSLAEGGEFVTHLWALLFHAGIFEQPPASSV